MPTPRRAGIVLGAALLAPFAAATPATAATGAPDPFGPCPPSWNLVSTDTFQGTDALTRSQGVTTDGTDTATGLPDWYFSWQGGISRTEEVAPGTYVERAYGTWAPQQAVAPSGDPTGENHVGNNHIGDIDYYDGTIYAPFEDGGEGNLNNPEYQTPYIETYDPTTLRNTGAYHLDPKFHDAGVPWVAIDGARKELITGEWDMPNDRLNIYNLPLQPDTTGLGLTPDRILKLVYPPELGAGFHLGRIQGAKVYGDTLYATRDKGNPGASDTQVSVWAINLTNGSVKELFTLDPGAPDELEGLAVRPMPDGSLLHLLIVVDNQEDPQDPNSAKIHVEFRHYGPVADPTCPGPSLPETPLVPAVLAVGVIAAGAVALRRRTSHAA